MQIFEPRYLGHSCSPSGATAGVRAAPPATPFPLAPEDGAPASNAHAGATRSLKSEAAGNQGG